MDGESPIWHHPSGGKLVILKKMHLYFDPEIPLLGSHPEDIPLNIHKIHAHKFTAYSMVCSYKILETIKKNPNLGEGLNG